MDRPIIVTLCGSTRFIAQFARSMLEELGIEQTPEFTLSILTYEVGKIHQFNVYIQRFGEAGYIADREVELGDIIIMAKLLAEQYGYDVKRLEDIGLERFKERLQEVKRSELIKKNSIEFR